MGFSKPAGYDEATVTGEFIPLELGGHLLVIKQVEIKRTASNTNDMLVISLDTDLTDKQPKYFENQYRDDIRPEKKWGCVHYIVQSDNEFAIKNLKTFITSVEKSNPGFKVQWGDNFGAQFKGKKIGGVFGQEEYMNSQNEIKKSTKIRYFRSIDSVLDAQVPALKEYKGSSSAKPSSDGFMNLPDGIDEELPFN